MDIIVMLQWGFFYMFFFNQDLFCQPMMADFCRPKGARCNKEINKELRYYHQNSLIPSIKSETIHYVVLLYITLLHYYA